MVIAIEEYIFVRGIHFEYVAEYKVTLLILEKHFAGCCTEPVAERTRRSCQAVGSRKGRKQFRESWQYPLIAFVENILHVCLKNGVLS